jgi:Flp pilus assembly protein TadG
MNMKRAKERGVQVVELAITLPLLCLLVFAITDGADFVRTHVILNNAAREGARMAASAYCPGCSTTYIQNYVRSYVLNYINSETNGLGIGPGNVNGRPRKDAWCSASAFGASNISVNPSANYSYTDPTVGLMTGIATKVTISYPYTFCYVSGFANVFGGMSKTVTLSTQASFRNLY